MKRNKIRYYLLITIVAFIINAVIPFFATYNLPHTSSNTNKELSSIFGSKLLICTSEGFKWVNLEDVQNGNAPKPHPEFKCPLCYVAVRGLFIQAQPAAQIADLLVMRSIRFHLDADISITDRLIPNYNLVRAPPFYITA